MQLQLISSPQKSVQYASPDERVSSAWLRARTCGSAMLMIRNAHGLRMLRSAELERYATARPHDRLSELPLHDVGIASSLATVRELEEQMRHTGVEAIAMIRSNEVLALLTKVAPASESHGHHRVSFTPKIRSAA